VLRWALITLVAGCYRPTIQAGAPCTTDTDCPGTQQCIAMVCGGSAIDAAIVGSDAMADAQGEIDAPADAAIQEIVIGDDPAQVRDTEIWGDFPTTPQGGNPHFSVDLNESGLVWFDLTSIPPSKTVVKATLTVKVDDMADEAGGTVTIHRLREGWVEAEATWAARATNQAWSVDGARSPSSDIAPVATFSPAAVQTAYDIDLPVQLVEDWTNDPAVNFGIVFVRGTSLEHVHVHTRENAPSPKLTVRVY
jgi:hypothetical protein